MGVIDMTIDEAIKRLDRNAYRTTCYGNRVVEHEENLIAIQALRDIQQYLEVGTVDECREANGKQMPKKVKEDGYFGFVDYVCPTCGHDAGSSGTNYCKNCGQKLRWR